MLDYDPSAEQQLHDLLRSLGQEGQKISFTHLAPIFASLCAAVKKINPIIVIIAGTNGKGETAYRLQNLVQQQGLSSALWISPHVFSLRERMLFNGQMLSYGAWQTLLMQTWQEVGAAGLSYYEFLFYAFLKSFLEHPTQVLLLEVGLGGRLDAVNLLAADIGIITSIGRDHQAFLGKTYRAILQEKLGITRPGQILLSALELKYLQQQIQAWAAQNHLAWQDLFGQGVLKKTDPYPQRNAALALRAEQAIKDLSKARKILAAPGRAAAAPPLTLGPGRREFWPKACPGPHNQWLFIGGHNPDGLRKMAAYLHQEKIKIDQVLASFTQRPYQDLQANLQMLLQLDGHPPITLAAFDHPKAVPLADLQNLARDVCLAVPIKVKCWHQRLQEEFGHEAGTTLVTGSFYFVGLVQHAFLAAGPSRDGGVCHRR